MQLDKVSIVLPAKNEAESLSLLLRGLTKLYPDAEVIVVDDGSTDNTKDICLDQKVLCVSHPYSKGNGAAIKTGVSAASGDIIVCMDADGQHNPEDILKLIEKLKNGFDMAVGARSNSSQATYARSMANGVYNCLASLMTGHRVEDLTSGFRAVESKKFKQYLYMLPNGFSYPTTITMAFFRAGFSVAYIPVNVKPRIGKSHIKPLKDGARFLAIIFKIGTLYSPLKIFIPFSLLFFLSGIGHYAYTYIVDNRFTNMSALLFSVSVVIFLIGLVSEQITTLMYERK